MRCQTSKKFNEGCGRGGFRENFFDESGLRAREQAVAIGSGEDDQPDICIESFQLAKEMQARVFRRQAKIHHGAVRALLCGKLERGGTVGRACNGEPGALQKQGAKGQLLLVIVHQEHLKRGRIHLAKTILAITIPGTAWFHPSGVLSKARRKGRVSPGFRGAPGPETMGTRWRPS